MSDIASLLSPATDPPPCGPDLEYDRRFIALSLDAAGKPERRMGAHIVPAEQPDWSSVRWQAEALLEHSKDLRVALLLTRALVRLDQLAGLRDGLALLRGLIERYWEQVHPVPNPADPRDLVTRMNVLARLADRTGLLADVRGAQVVAAGPHGRVTVRDILLATGRQQPAPGEAVPSQARIDDAIAAAAREGAPDDAAACLASLAALETLLGEKAAGDIAAPELAPLFDVLKPVAAAWTAALPTAAPGTSTAAPGTPAGMPGAPTAAPGSPAGMPEVSAAAPGTPAGVPGASAAAPAATADRAAEAWRVAGHAGAPGGADTGRAGAAGMPGAGGGAVAEAAPNTANAAPAAAPGDPVPSGPIRNRADAMQALDSVCLYYERAEPGNPAPLLIRRAQRLIGKSFVEILQDLAPDSLAQVRAIVGIENE
ncbi:type VI secretion system protein TssA [Pseudoduganella namucuonensis]|uniref:Type VI secretion-associated protein, ImpA family n=1 Tax=Pseudoduganella namucuonensis TaxID=1035707 RepID=A0A1I7KPQ2_9BURK|nr:type VI secretion system ImpA family N-terminal domain-containing protein [Pseudoduganella namucuonensis]SFU99344.1 type VI secretion-associated protein, ImpA family [Pseudoduganella namucuonensis]